MGKTCPKEQELSQMMRVNHRMELIKWDYLKNISINQ